MKTLDGATFDIVVIGAGINGASCAQSLSAEGYSVLIVDKGDFGSGSTSRSTRMLHCGLRYFETPRPVVDFALHPGKLWTALRMAKAAMETRGEIVKDSTSRVRPIKLCFPIFHDGPYKPWQLDLAFGILGRFGPSDVPLDYERIRAARAKSLPLIEHLRDLRNLHSVAVFTEYMFDWPERLCIDAVLDAERMGAAVRNYTSARLLNRDEAGRWRVRLADELREGDDAEVTAPIVLNMAGIWIDEVNRVPDSKARRRILGTKGAHIAVELPPACRDYGIAAVNSIGEPHYCLPSQGGLHHIGPTETVYEGDIDDIRVDAADLSFLLGETNAALPGLKVTEADVVYTWAGVRPLTHDPAYPKGKRSREIHDLGPEGLPGVYAMTAGPVMTHRSAGPEMTAVVRQRLQPTGSVQDIDHTPRRFPDNPNSPLLFEDDADVRLSDLNHAVRAEHATDLADILIARTGVFYAHRMTDDEVHRAAAAVSVELGWCEDRMKAEIAKFNAMLATVYGLDGGATPDV